MAATSDLKTVNLRIPAQLWSALKQIAEDRNLSFNKFAEEALSEAAREERRKQVQAAFIGLSKSSEGVEWAMPAQSEVALRDDP